MFDNLKDIYNLRKQAQDMEKKLVAEKVEATSASGLIRLVINGKNDLLEVQIAERDQYDRKELAQNFKEAHEKAQKSLQRILVDKFKGMV
jgi:DNA-binding protein YbaB